MEEHGGGSQYCTQTQKLTGFLLFFPFFSATPKPSPSPDYLCWDDPLPDVWGHQCKAGADGGPHELSAMLCGASGTARCQYLRRVGPLGWGFWFCFCCVVFCFVFCIMYFCQHPINFFDLYFFSHSFIFIFFSFEILFQFLFVWEEMSSLVLGPENARLI